MRARLIDWAVEEVGRLAAEGQGLDSTERVVGLQDRVVAEPRRRPVRGGAGHAEAQREDALGLDADVQVGRLAGDREVAAQALAHEPVDRVGLDVLGLLVGDADEAHADAVLVGGVADGAHHRREAALHVVGAAADQPVALDPRLELLGVRGHDVDVAVQDDRRRAAVLRRRRRRRRDRQALVVVLAHVDVARLQPALDEARGASRSPSGVEVSVAMRRSASARSSMADRV